MISVVIEEFFRTGECRWAISRQYQEFRRPRPLADVGLEDGPAGALRDIIYLILQVILLIVDMPPARMFSLNLQWHNAEHAALIVWVRPYAPADIFLSQLSGFVRATHDHVSK